MNSLNSNSNPTAATGADYIRKRARRSGGPALSTGYLLVASSGEIMFCLGAGVLTSVLAAPLYMQISGWIGLVLGMMVAIACHMIFTFKYFPSWPHLIVLFAGVQLVLLAWLGCYVASSPGYEIGERTGEYLSYGAPAWMAYTAGWFIALVGLPTRRLIGDGTIQSRSWANPQLLDTILMGGIGFMLARRYVYIPSLNFAMDLLANVRFIGGAAWLISRAQGWQRRLALLLIVEIFNSTQSGMFGDLALWSLALLPLWLYQSKMRRTTVLCLVILSFVSLSALESAKTRYRDKAWFGNTEADPVFGINVRAEGLEKPVAWLLYLADGAYRTVTFQLSGAELSHLLDRHNHGWIVNQVMMTVPQSEPYARGETIRTAIKAALLPRFLSEEKYRAGGQYFERFTGRSLESLQTGERGVSMNLGFTGEFYANYGKSGGILACGIWGLLSGLILRWFYRRSLHLSLWLAFFPFVFMWGMKAEEGIGEILNWIVKASLVSAAIILFSPLRQAFQRRTPGKEVRPPQTQVKPDASALPPAGG